VVQIEDLDILCQTIVFANENTTNDSINFSHWNPKTNFRQLEYNQFERWYEFVGYFSRIIDFSICKHILWGFGVRDLGFGIREDEIVTSLPLPSTRFINYQLIINYQLSIILPIAVIKSCST
jgi:hypothetical protein